VIRGKALRPEDLLQIARRRSQILLPFLVVSLVTFVVVRRLPDRYRSETLILVVPQRVPESYVRATVTTRIQDRLATINQQIMSRTRLEPVIREFNLYPELVKSGLMEDVVDRMRKDADVRAVRGDAFSISYMASDPHTAMRVTERLASMYMDENMRDREVVADGTNSFLESQLSAAKEKLLETEKRLEDYNRRYSGQLPSQVQSNLQVLQNAQLQVQQLSDSLLRDKDRRRDLELQLKDPLLGASSLLASTDASGVTTIAPPPIGPINAELEKERKTLVEMQRRLKPEHPDIRMQQAKIRDLEPRAREEQAMIANLPPDAVRTVDRTELARQARAAQIRGELDNIAKQIAEKERDELRLRATIAEYQARVEASPTRASELVELTRDYQTQQDTYTVLLRKKEDAQIAANLERYQIGEQFKSLDPARLPEKPFSPDRPRLYTLGAIIGLGLGLGLAIFLEFRDTTLKTDEDVVMALGLPVLALIPELITDAEKAAKRRRRTFASLATAGAAMVLAGILFWVFRSNLF
jgi:polysaccharide chain length determinant protein (PEP-CTERM system associated)